MYNEKRWKVSCQKAIARCAIPVFLSVWMLVVGELPSVREISSERFPRACVAVIADIWRRKHPFAVSLQGYGNSSGLTRRVSRLSMALMGNGQETSKFEPVSTKEWIWTLIVLLIPLLNIFLLLCWSVSPETNPSKRNYSSACIVLALSVFAFYVVKRLFFT